MFGVNVSITGIAAGHHVGIGEDRIVLLTSCQKLAQFLHIKRRYCYISEFAQIIPRFNAIEHLKDKYSQQNIFRRVSIYVLIDDIADEILTHTVTGAIDIRELILPQNRIIRQTVAILTPPPEDIHPLLNEVEVVFQRSIIGYDATSFFSPHRCLTSGD